MKQWRIVAVVFSLLVLLLVANFSIQFRRRGKRSDRQKDQSKSSVIDAVFSTAGPKTTVNTSSVENAEMIANSDCWKTEETYHLAQCVQCSDYEKKRIKGCLLTGNIQLTYCVDSNIKFYGSCRLEDEKKFWVFQGFVFVMLICSSFMVWYRQRQLDNVFYQKLQKQVESDPI